MRKLLYAGAVAVSLLASGCGAADEKDTTNPAAVNEPDETTPETSPSEYTSGMTSPSVTASPTSPIQQAPTGPARIDTATTSLGTVLVGYEGRTVYLFTGDKHDQPSCAGACAAAWPPVLTMGQPQAGTGVKGNLLGTVKRADSTTQVTYNKHPLYYYVKDQKAGDVTGQGVKDFGGEWYAVTPEGKKAKH